MATDDPRAVPMGCDLEPIVVSRCCPTSCVNELIELRRRNAEIEAEIKNWKGRYDSLLEDFNGRLNPIYDYVDGMPVSVAEDEIDRLQQRNAEFGNGLDRMMQDNSELTVKVHQLEDELASLKSGLSSTTESYVVWLKEFIGLAQHESELRGVILSELCKLLGAEHYGKLAGAVNGLKEDIDKLIFALEFIGNLGDHARPGEVTRLVDAVLREVDGGKI